MLEFSIYLLYRAASALVSALPLPFLFRLGEWSGFVAWLVLPGYRRLARHNCEIAFAHEKSSAELSLLVRRHFQRLGANLLSSIKMSSMPIDDIARRVEIENVDSLHRELRTGHPVVVALSHLGNWELNAQFVPQLIGYVRNGTIYQPLRNRRIDADVRQKRARAGVEMFDRQAGFQGPIELLRSGGVIGILSDQHAGDHGVWTPFFGRLASTSPLPALLAKRTGAAVIAAAIYTEGRARWRLAFTTRINVSGDSVAKVTARTNDVIEEQIRRAPEDWFWVHNRWKTPRPNFLLGHYKRGIYLPPEIVPSDLKPFRILIRSPNWLGDSVMSMPAVRAIKAGRPDAHITIVTPEKIAAVWKLLPEVDSVIPLTRKSLFGAVRAINAHSAFDVALLLPNSLRAAVEVWLASIPRRVGYSGHRRCWLLNQVVPDRQRFGPPTHQANEYLRMACALGAGIDAGSFACLPVAPAGSQEITRIGLCPGAEYGPAKRWLPERFAEVASNVAAEQSVHWILFGTAADAEIGRAIAARLGESCTNLIGKTTLDQLVIELRRCRLLLTNDTGTMHLAALLGVPVVALFGSTEPRLTGPIGSGHRVIRHQVECSPCFLRKCPIDFRCMQAISVAEVAAAVVAQLTKNVVISR